MDEQPRLEKGSPPLEKYGAPRVVNPFPIEGVRELIKVFLVPREFSPDTLVLPGSIEARKATVINALTAKTVSELRARMKEVAENAGEGYRLASLKELIAYMGHREETRGRLQTPVLAVAPIAPNDERFAVAIPRSNGEWMIAIVGEKEGGETLSETERRALEEVGVREGEREETWSLPGTLVALRGQSQDLKLLIFREPPLE